MECAGWEARYFEPVRLHRCVACGTNFSGPAWACPSCGFRPRQIGRITSFVSGESGQVGFEAEFFPRLASLEEDFWWFEARNDVIAWSIERWNGGSGEFLEIGCGTGFVVSAMSRRFPALHVSASEFFAEGLEFVAHRLPQGRLYQIDARRLPFHSAFDIVGAFDVIEHIDEDQEVLRQIKQALRPQGIALITVPQHPFLWNAGDDFAYHKRRYTRRDLREKLERAGFEVLALRSFVSFLLPLQIVARLRPSRGVYDPSAEFQISDAVNAALKVVMQAELKCIRQGMSLPFGGSLLAVGRPESSPRSAPR